MSGARLIAELSELLRARADTSLFAPGALERLVQQPETSEVLPYAARATKSPEAVLRLALQALAIQRSAFEPRLVDVELVATLPWGAPGLARPTATVLREMLRPPRERVVIAGYEITEDALLDQLVELARAGCAVRLICDRGKGSASAIRQRWPNDLPLPALFEDCERPDALPYAKMHTKTLLVDDRDLLITSANFTLHGLHGNIELGIRLQGGPAREVAKILDHFIASGLVVSI